MRREEHGAVSIRLKVHAHIVLLRRVVQVLHARLGARDRYLRLEVGRGGAVRVRGLHAPELQRHARRLDEVREVVGCQTRDLVAVEQVEAGRVTRRTRQVVEYDAIRIAIERAQQRPGLNGRLVRIAFRQALL